MRFESPDCGRDPALRDARGRGSALDRQATLHVYDKENTWRSILLFGGRVVFIPLRFCPVVSGKRLTRNLERGTFCQPA